MRRTERVGGLGYVVVLVAATVGLAACDEDPPRSPADGGVDASQPTPDAGTPPGAACTSAEASAVLADDQAVLARCVRECGSQPSCVRDCVEREAGARASCATCFGELVTCAASRCLSACETGPSADCSACACANGCGAELDACAGVAVPLCPACEEGPENTLARCTDGCSNDGDRFVDCDDWDCAGIGDCPPRGACTPDATEACGPSTEVGVCRSGTRTCGADGTWGECVGAVYPSEELCSGGEDEDCDGMVDEGCSSCSCGDRRCGPDGCGGSCGTCTAPAVCDVLAGGVCVGGECTPGAVRCIAGAPAEAETCDSVGRWVRAPCGDAQLCSLNACRPVCRLTASPATATVCFVPNRDNVNNGLLFWTNRIALLGPPRAIPVVLNSADRPSRIQRIPSDVPSVDWPYEWIVDAGGSLRRGEVQFQLHQFAGMLPGPLRTVTLEYWARRQPPISIPSEGIYINRETRARRYAYAPGVGFFAQDDTHLLGIHYLADDVRTHRIIGAIGVPQFDHSTTCPTPDACNAIGVQIIGSRWGDPPMDGYINYLRLTVE